MKNYVKNMLFYVVLIALLAVSFQLFFQLSVFKLLLESINPVYFIHQVVLSFIFGTINAYLFFIIIKTFGVKLKGMEWVGLGFINTLSNYILPFKSGSTIRALYLKHSHNFQLSKCGSVIFATQFINLQCVLFLMGITSLILIYENHFNSSMLYKLCLIVFLVFCVNLVLLFFLTRITIDTQKPRTISWNTRIINIFGLFVDGLKTINQNTGLVVKIVFLCILNVIVQILRLHFAFMAFGIKISTLGTSFISLLTSLSGVLALTPGNLGVQEFIITAGSTLFGLSKEEGFLSAVIIRTFAILVTVITCSTLVIPFKKKFILKEDHQ